METAICLSHIKEHQTKILLRPLIRQGYDSQEHPHPEVCVLMRLDRAMLKQWLACVARVEENRERDRHFA